MIDVVTVGETMALLRAEQGEQLRSGSTFRLGFGGADSNVAIGLSRFGHRVRWISALGIDPFGDLIESGLLAEGVDVWVTRSEVKKTGLMVKSPSVTAVRQVTFYRAGSAASFMDESFVSSESLSGARILHLTGITPLLSASCKAMVLVAIERAKELGLTVSFDVNYRSALWSAEEARAAYAEIVPKIDIVFGDRFELGLLGGQDNTDGELLAKVSALGPKTVVLKLGEEGATALVAGELYHQPAVKVDVVDTVGAGDAFVAGYLSAVLDGEAVSDAMFRAAFCGAQACTNLGDWEGAATRADFDLARQELVK